MVADVKRLRVDAFIDQRDAPYVKKDDLVVVTLPERPGFKLDGKVARVTNELDPRTKMLLTEIDIPNENNDLVAGSFVQVSLTIKSPAYIEAPVEALVLKDDKTFLTALKDDSTLTYKQIAVGPNDGKVIAVSSGATVGDKVILNIGTTLPEGSKVRPLAEPSPAPAGAKK
jgi:multidrug efflux pump subunit AcrA (membrane-fusion protein)